MLYYLFKSPYRLALLGLVLALVGLWYLWLKTDQIIGSTLPVYTTGVVLLNSMLGFFSFDRHPYITRFFIICSYVLIAIAAYTLYSLTRGIRL